jgi:hypothetical protein
MRERGEACGSGDVGRIGLALRCMAVGATVAALASCTPHAPRRLAGTEAVETSVSLLSQPAVRKEVAGHSAEIHRDFDLAFVEFDDQGRLWNLEQVDNLKRTLASAVQRAEGAGVGIIAFAHGWQHDARVCDDVVACYRSFLASLAAETAAAARLARADARPPRIVGVYLGWRGRSVTTPWVAELSFWFRKAVAKRIGAGELVEVLAYLDQFSRQENEAGRPATLSIIGHSFGGTMIYSALANPLKARLVEALEQRGRVPVDENVVRGFGNLVLLVNPAIEAAAFAPLHDLSRELEVYSSRQTPVLVVVGSETDKAARVWFRLGQKAETCMQATGPRSQRVLLTTAIGNYDPFTTHRLEAIGPSDGLAPTTHVADCNCRLPIGDLTVEELRKVGEFFRTHRFFPPWAGEDPGEACTAGVVLGSARLTCLPGVAPSQPIWSVRATGEAVSGHSGFITRPFLDLLRYLILSGFQSPAPG